MEPEAPIIKMEDVEQEKASGPKDGLQLSPIQVREDYKRKWNVDVDDFYCLTYNGKLLRPTLYRTSPLFNAKDLREDYFMLFKHVESYFPDEVTTDPDRKPRLESRECILDRYGNEKVEFADNPLDHATLINNGVVYRYRDRYYNVETGEEYCRGYTTARSSRHIFVELRPMGGGQVMRIDTKTGESEIFE